MTESVNGSRSPSLVSSLKNPPRAAGLHPFFPVRLLTHGSA